MRARLRLVWRIAALLATTIGCVIPHLIARRRGPSPWPQRFLGRSARAAGFDVRIAGTPLLHDVFYVANHLSWIDILAMGGATGCAFISKDGVARAPIVGWLAAQNNTIFVAREKRGEVASHIETVRTALAAHQPIALFAEGGTGDGKTLGPFKPPLFEVLLPPPRNILIQPVLVDYGEATRIVVWGDESGTANARRILSSPGRKTVTLHFLEPFDPGAHPDRKTLAAETRKRIAAAKEQMALERIARLPHASSSSWKHEPFGALRPIDFSAEYSPVEFARIKLGLLPEAMEDKWFAYVENGTLHFHRSRSGMGLLQVELSATANGGKAIRAHCAEDFYEKSDPAYPARLLAFLIDNFMLRRERPFPLPEGMSEAAPGAFQHAMTGTAYPEERISGPQAE